MAAQRKYPEELRERAVKIVFEIRERDGKGHGENRQTLRRCAVRKARRFPVWSGLPRPRARSLTSRT
jgi:hypothetical protein